jgi:hypothetical protein
MSAGKGSTPRKVDCGKYAVNYEKIFGKTEVYICHKCYRIKINHYTLGWICEDCEWHGEPY